MSDTNEVHIVRMAEAPRETSMVGVLLNRIEELESKVEQLMEMMMVPSTIKAVNEKARASLRDYSRPVTGGPYG
jgi:hypothetical protein